MLERTKPRLLLFNEVARRETMHAMTPVYVDSDNAIVARAGDVDDAFALAALLLSDVRVAAIGAVAGNTSAANALAGNRETARRCGWDGPLLAGVKPGESAPSDAAAWLASAQGPLRVVALGPLTNIARALRLDGSLASRIEEVVLVGGNRGSRGRWPPFWPWEFNLWRDRDAAAALFASRIPLTIVPLDVAKRLMFRGSELAALRGEPGEWLCRQSRRWLWRARLIKLRDRFPVWDLVAAMVVVERSMFDVARVPVRFSTRGHLAFGGEGRDADVVVSFERDAVWKAFVELVERRAAQTKC